MAIRFIIDAACDLSAKQTDAMGVTLIPMTITFGSEEYKAGVDITNEEFYNKLVADKDLPTTSQPAPYAYECVYQQVKDAGDEAVVLCLSSALSGTYQSASIAADGFEDCVYVIDTRAVSVAQRLLLEYGMTLKEQGLSAKQIAAELERKKGDLCIYGAVDTLEYLIRGGRLSKAAGAVGSVLGIKPVLMIKDGSLIVAGKARGSKAAISMTHNFIDDIGVDFSMPYALGYTGNDSSVITPFQNALDSNWNSTEVPVYNVGSAVGTHAGPGLVLAAFFKKT